MTMMMMMMMMMVKCCGYCFCCILLKGREEVKANNKIKADGPTAIKFWPTVNL